MQECRICTGTVQSVLRFGRMPVANGFLREDEFGHEPFHELELGRCPDCSMVQLIGNLDRSAMFHGHYAFYSSTSMHMQQHFAKHARRLLDGLAGRPDPFVVELGSNDGILLRHMLDAGTRHLGVEPSTNVAEVARQAGVQTRIDFFGRETAEDILSAHGPADVITAANVMCHIDSLNDVLKGVEVLLHPDGILVFEDPYLMDILEKVSYDQIYDEHIFYFCLHSVDAMAARHGLRVVDVEALDVHGGSMRYTLARPGSRPVADSVQALREREAAMGVEDPETYTGFAANVRTSRERLVDAVRSARALGKRIVGYGATSKSTTVINYCGLTPEDIEFISDTTPIKQGKFSPGAHIPVLAPEHFRASYPDIALLFAWNHAREIRDKERAFVDAGGKWLTYVPRVEISV